MGTEGWPKRPLEQAASQESAGRSYVGLALVAIVTLAAALRLYFFVGVTRLDMFRYVEVSHHVLSGGSLFDESVFFASARLPLIGPLVLANRIGGYGERVSVAWPLLASICSVVVVYALAKELFSAGRTSAETTSAETTALLAALVFAVLPLEVELATQIMPDPVEGLFVLLAVLLSVLAVRRDRGWRVYAIGSGFCLGLAYFTRVNALVLLPGIVAVGAFIEPRRWKRSLWAIPGLAACLVAFAGVFWLLSGDPFVDWRTASETYSAYSSSGFIVRKESFFAQFLTEPGMRFVLPIFVAGAIAALLKKERERYLLLFWALGFYVYLEFLGPLHGLDSSYRYAEPLVAPSVLLFSAALMDVARRSAARRVAVFALAAVLLVASVPTTASVTRSWRRNVRWLWAREVARSTKDRPEPLFIEHPWLLVSVDYYSKYAFRRDTLDSPDSPRNRHARLFRDSERPLPRSGRALLLTSKGVPRGWRVVWTKPSPYPSVDLDLHLVESAE